MPTDQLYRLAEGNYVGIHRYEEPDKCASRTYLLSGLEGYVEAMSKSDEIVEGSKKKYGVSSLKEFEEKIVSGEVNPNYPGTSALRTTGFSGAT